MANTDSFIDEVTEEVRRDRLFELFRKWAWLAGLIVVALVGGAAWLEYSRAQERAAAEAFGDAVLLALDAEDAAARIAALEGIDAPGPVGAVLLALLAAGEAADAEGAEAAAARLRATAEDPDLPRRFRDLALLKAQMLAPAAPEEARLVMAVLAEPGAPFAALAEEQLALIDIAAGDTEAGIDRLRALERSAAASPGLQQRVAQLIVALEAGSVLVDPPPPEAAPEVAPEPEPAPETEPAPDDAAPVETAPEADAEADTGADTGAETGAETDTDAPASGD